ncbi:amino acid permease-associated region [Haloterrigena turkmenica DSM 5511]|uniref:Amino acid permease-associated region n=1 Tax=Haloterrigena turkmenica (strain ATCC 51198 / DSM 5511 / JCM 9101 / NCIMB 13204 / VKM B-1734 / 4k) TaxID=543526 RepID=D2RQY9_HALTV|nr:amino acid permease [Haloterrigena turkmenica]ADB60470.1 amino acid permease-associated region [Haloterrigena turkmenica DSM 5511]
MAEHTRTLDFKIAFAIGLGTMIAAGIFSLSGAAVAMIGSSAIIAFVIAALVAGITAASYSEFASIYSENGGGYLFNSRTFEERRLLTYGVGASLFLGYTGTTAFYLATMDEWFVRFIIPESLHWLPHGTAGVVTAVLLGVLNVRGTEESGTFQLLVTGAKVAVLLAFIAGAFAYRGPATATANFAGQFQADAVGIVTVAALAFITFFGFSAIAASAGEIIEPRRTVPRAIAASIVTVTILYALVIVAMTNSTVPPEIVAEEGETAMGLVAEGFLGPPGQALIVAGAVFSMVSASNASILAATGIGSLMARRGQAPRPLFRIHSDYGTPFWSVVTVTATIVAMIVFFIGLFPAENAPLGLDLGLTALTGFATLNLLLPLSVVNAALIVHRRRFPDVERGFRVPGVPVVPALGILANLALIYNLPVRGVVTGIALVAVLLVAYLTWGGAPEVEELLREVVPAERGGTEPATAAGESGSGANPATEGAAETSEESETSGERFRVLVPIARPERAPGYVRLAAALGRGREREPFVQVLNVTEIPDQTPHEVVAETAQGRADRIADALADESLDVEYSVEGHTSRDVAFDVVQTARNGDADLILMGYPDEHPGLTEAVEYDAPCDVVFAAGFDDVDPDSIATVTVGAGGGPHHRGSLSTVRSLIKRGGDVQVVSVTPGDGGTPEDPADTVAALDGVDVDVTEVAAATVADGLVEAAETDGGVLVVGASRDRRLSQWVFGSTPDRVVDRAEEAAVPVLVYASASGVPGRIEDYLFPVYRYLRRRLRNAGIRPFRRFDPSHAD